VPQRGLPAFRPALNGARALLVVGIHREELAFGKAVAEGLDRDLIEVLVIPQGLSGRHPRQDQKFHSDTLHRALYRQLLAHVRGRYPLLIDLHTGLDAEGPCVDLYSAEPDRWRGALRELADAHPDIGLRAIRLVTNAADGGATNGCDTPLAATVIPEEIWRNPAFRYLCVEVYLREPGAGDPRLWAYTRRLLSALVG
jgi:hypothetical protein